MATHSLKAYKRTFQVGFRQCIVDRTASLFKYQVSINLLLTLTVAELQKSVELQAQNLRSLTKELFEFKHDYEARKKQDTYRFAEIAEVDDFKTNNANITKILITGTRLILL